MASIHRHHELRHGRRAAGLPASFFLWRMLAAFAAALLATNSALAVVAQEPLLSKAGNVKPNIAFILDASGSMEWECLYTINVINALITEFPEKAPRHVNGVSTDCFAADDIRQASPNNNLLYYNPGKTFGPGYVKGVLQGPAKIDDTSVVSVYLARDPGKLSTYTQSSDITRPTNYDFYEVTRDGFKKGDLPAAGNPFGKHMGSRSDCAADPCTFREERQNIANWRAYHRNRMGVARTGLSAAFAPQADNFRLAYADLWGPLTVMKDFGMVKNDFFSWLDNTTTDRSTPLLDALDRAGQYYQRKDKQGPWGTTPWAPPANEKPEDHLSCRRSHTLLITDGFYTDGYIYGTALPAGIKDQDGKKGPALAHGNDPAKKFQYIPGDKKDPRSKGKSDRMSGSAGNPDTLADVAMKYWVNDLRDDLPNNIGNGGANDPPFWQNMTSHFASFGAVGEMTDAQVALAQSGKLDWPAPVAYTSSTIDDMRHAAHNGGGEFLMLTNAEQFSADVGALINTIAGQHLSESGVAASGTVLTTSTKKFVPSYTSGSWWGNLQMVTPGASVRGNDVVDWQVIATDATGQPTGATTLPAPKDRNILVWVDAARQAVAFTYFNVRNSAYALRGGNSNMQMSASVSADVVNFLRGDKSKEGSGFRTRPAVLGDIVNSTPVLIKNNTNPMYEKLPPGTPGLESYKSYLDAKGARREGVLFVGANDGMLHAFREGSGPGDGGREMFAYVPRSVLGKMEALSSTRYPGAHTYLVDGPLSEVDAYVAAPGAPDSAARWRNLVLGTTGAGAKAVFALNVTDPLKMNGKSVLWEINADPAFPLLPGNVITDFKELGYVLSPVQSGITASGDWVSIFGNGYDSKSGQASLFIVETGSGKLLREIKTDGATRNGLGGVRLVLDARQQIIGAYAGDLLGRLWKFDLGGAPSTWRLGNGGSALFTALSADGKPLPITAQPAVMERTDQPSYKPSYMVSIPSGKLFEAGDPATTQPVQAAYGLWDRKPFGSSGSDTISPSRLTSLTASVVTKDTKSADAVYTVSYADSSITGIDWSSQRGWKLDLDVFAGQRVIYPLQILGEVVKIDTVAPLPTAQSCQALSGSAASFYISPLTGICRHGGTLDTNADGKIDKSDANACAYASRADGVDVVLTILDSAGAASGVVAIGDSGGQKLVRIGDGKKSQPDCSDAAYAAANASQCSVPPGTPATVVNRSWRQIFPRAK